jgi:SAM-dependent methyltransferase
VVDLRARATDPEGLDVGVPEEEARRSLADIRFVNRWLGNRGAFLRAVLPFLRDDPRPRLLDVGCGSGDVPALVKDRLRGRLQAVGVDIKLLHLRAAPADLQGVVADVRALPFRPQSFDVVTASLFLHHFDAPELPTVLRGLFALARRALVVNDLRRAHVPYHFGRLVFPFLFESRVSMEDGLISIRRSFTPSELRRAFEDAGLPQVRIATTFPYRILAVAARDGDA